MLLLLFCLTLLLVGSDAREYWSNVRVWHNLQTLHDASGTYHVLMQRGFGFAAGGEVRFTLTCPVGSNYPPNGFAAPGRPDFWLLFCSTGNARKFFSMLTIDCQQWEDGGAETISHSEAICRRQKVHYNNSVQGQYMLHANMEDSYFYTLILLQCQRPQPEISNLSFTMQCASSLMAVNPGGNQLSTDEIPLPLIYTIINLVWATLVAAWFFNWVIYFKFSNRLHRLISCAPIFKVVLVVLVLIWWQEIANTGSEPADISTVRYFVQSLEDSLLFITMMIIAEGWGVLRSHIKHYRWTSLLLLLVIFATSLMCVHWVHRYFLAFSVCCVVFMMYKTLKWSSHNIELLRRRHRKIRRFVTRHNLHYSGHVTLDMQLLAKLVIFRRFRIVCAAFSMAYAIAVTLATFLQEFAYIRALIFEIPELLIYIAIGFLFRLRNFEPYETIELVPPKENIVVVELPDVCYGLVEPHVALGLPLHFKVEKETQTPHRRWRPSIR